MATDVKVGDFVDVIFLEQSGKAVAQIVGVESAGPQGPAGVFTGHFQNPNGLYSLARCAPWRDSMVPCQAVATRFGSNTVWYLNKDQAIRAILRAMTTKAAVLGNPLLR